MSEIENVEYLENGISDIRLFIKKRMKELKPLEWKKNGSIDIGVNSRISELVMLLENFNT